MAGIVAYEIKWPIKFLGRVVLSTIKLKNCAEESENRCFTVEHSWALRKLSPLNILLTLNGPLLF